MFSRGRGKPSTPIVGGWDLFSEPLPAEERPPPTGGGDWSSLLKRSLTGLFGLFDEFADVHPALFRNRMRGWVLRKAPGGRVKGTLMGV